jgi:hypothetical protein
MPSSTVTGPKKAPLDGALPKLAVPKAIVGALGNADDGMAYKFDT